MEFRCPCEKSKPQCTPLVPLYSQGRQMQPSSKANFTYILDSPLTKELFLENNVVTAVVCSGRSEHMPYLLLLYRFTSQIVHQSISVRYFSLFQSFNFSVMKISPTCRLAFSNLFQLLIVAHVYLHRKRVDLNI